MCSKNLFLIKTIFLFVNILYEKIKWTFTWQSASASKQRNNNLLPWNMFEYKVSPLRSGGRWLVYYLNNDMFGRWYNYLFRKCLKSLELHGLSKCTLLFCCCDGSCEHGKGWSCLRVSLYMVIRRADNARVHCPAHCACSPPLTFK